MTRPVPHNARTLLDHLEIDHEREIATKGHLSIDGLRTLHLQMHTHRGWEHKHLRKIEKVDA